MDKNSLRKKCLKDTIDKYDLPYGFLATESKYDICFSPTRLVYAAHEVTIFRKHQ